MFDHGSEPMCGSSPMQQAAKDRSQTVSAIGVPIQKCPELLPPSPLGAYDGFGKCASTAVIFGSVFRSVTTPSWDSEAQAQSNHAIIKASIPQHAACLFTTRNLLIDDLDATSGFPALMLKERSHEKLLRGQRSSPLVPYGRQLGRA